MAKSTKDQKTKAQIYREERKKRIAKQQKKQSKITAASRKRKRIIKRIVLSVIAVILIAAITAGIVFATGVPNRYLSAAKIGDHEITVAEYNFYYNTTVQNFLSQYGSYASMFGFDSTKPYDKQDASAFGAKTYADYFRSQTLQMLQTNVVLNDLAKEEGITLTDEDQSVINRYMESLKEILNTNNVSITKMFGKGATEETVKEAFTKYTLAQRYGTYKRSTYTYTDADLEKQYTDNKDTYDVVSYMSYTFASQAATDADDAAKKAAMEDAKKLADAMLAKVTDQKTFAEQAKENAADDKKENYEDEDATLNADRTKGAVSSTKAAEWLFDSARKVGDKTVIENESDYTVLYLVEPSHRLDYKTINVRHILIQPETTGDAEATDEQKAAAKQKAEDLYNTFKAGDKTEDSFAQLARDNSMDDGSSSNGGLYENVGKGDMVDTFNDWCFDSTRKVGDTGIVETDYGYHIMYFSGYGEIKWKDQTNSDLVDNAYNTFFNEKTANYTISENKFGLFWAEK